jgi:hypothetical protein
MPLGRSLPLDGRSPRDDCLLEVAGKHSVAAYVMGKDRYLANKGVDFQGEWNYKEAFPIQLNCRPKCLMTRNSKVKLSP